MASKNFFSKNQQADIINAIKSAEKETSGEIRVHIEDTCKGDSIRRAGQIFRQLNMHETELRNGILFYLAVKSRDFAVIGDAGIHARVGSGFWESIKNKAIAHFKQEQFAEGLQEGILECGQQLKRYFPISKNDKNELNDEISFS